MPTPMPTDEVKIILAREMDLAGMMKVEQHTFGSWNEVTFRTILRQQGVVCYVAVYSDSLHVDRVVGFVVMEMSRTILKVINLAATWPSARKKLIDKAYERAAKHKVSLTFSG